MRQVDIQENRFDANKSLINSINPFVFEQQQNNP